jgi:hypothetical protein
MGFLLGNISGDKRSLVTQNQFNIFSETVPTGHKITLKYKQLRPEEPNLQRKFNQRGSFTFVGLQVPKSATNLNVASPQAIYTSFTRPYYQEIFEDRQNEELTILPEIEHLIQTSQNLYDPQGNPPGFVYQHLNGSRVLGVYIHDSEPLAEVEFSFVLPEGQDLVRFYGQPGLRQPSLGLGQGVTFYDYPGNVRSLRDYYQIHSGAYLQI